MADTDPEELERRIERTRAELARTVDAIADRVSPKRVVRRSVARMRENAETLYAVVGDMVGVPVSPAKSRPYDPWEQRERARRLALIGAGVVLVVGAVVVLRRRRRR